MLTKKLLLELEKFVNRHKNLMMFDRASCAPQGLYKIAQPDELEDFIDIKRKMKFSQVLFEFIDNKSANDSDIYKKAGIDRRHFSKIRSNPDYRPGKNTVIALALALQLDRKDTDKLLSSAGYSLSDSDTFDLVIQFCLEKKIYDFHDVNMALDYFSLKPLAGALL
jgi:hypothetical protein